MNERGSCCLCRREESGGSYVFVLQTEEASHGDVDERSPQVRQGNGDAEKRASY